MSSICQKCQPNACSCPGSLAWCDRLEEVSRQFIRGRCVPPTPAAPPATAEPRGLPKPARVERWQRWISLQERWFGELVVERLGADDIRFQGGAGTWLDTPLRYDHWFFLGYATPDRVEVGQRWRAEGRDLGTVLGFDSDGLAQFPLDVVAFSDRLLRKGEYLGMDERLASGAQAPIQDPPESGPVAPKPVHVADTMKAEVERANRTVEVNQRRADERELVDLVNNPPAWAEPTAWRAAVLCVREMCLDVHNNLANLDQAMEVVVPSLREHVAMAKEGRRFQVHAVGPMIRGSSPRFLAEQAIAAYERARFQPSQRLATVSRERVR